MKKFGDMVRDARCKKEISVHRLASKLREEQAISKRPGGAITMIERGQRPPTYSRALAIADALELADLEEVLKSAFIARITYAVKRESENLKGFVSKTRELERVDPLQVTTLTPGEIRSLFAE